MRAADLLHKVLERKAEAKGEIGVPSYDNMHTPDNHVDKKNMKIIKNPEKGLDTIRDEHPTAEVGKPGKEKRSLEGPGTKPKKMSEAQLNELEVAANAIVTALKLRYDGANERLLVNHPSGTSQGQPFYLPITRAKLERVLQNPNYLSSPLSFYAHALRQSQGGGRHIDFGENVGERPGGEGGPRRRGAYIDLAQDMIDKDNEVIYDVAVNQGQQVRNVKGMRWFLLAVADWLEENEYPVTESVHKSVSGEQTSVIVSKTMPTSHSVSVRAKQPDEPKNTGDSGKVKRKEKRAAADGRMDANPVSVSDFKGGQNEHKSMKKMHEGISSLEELIGRKLNINLGSKKKLSEADDPIEVFLHHYIGTALWASNDDAGEPMDAKYDTEDFATETLNKMKQDSAQFLKAAGPLLAQAEQHGYSIERAAHDFWLTRNHHGVGFWGRVELEEDNLGDQLTKVAQKFGEADLYVGDDGRIYQFSG